MGGQTFISETSGDRLICPSKINVEPCHLYRPRSRCLCLSSCRFDYPGGLAAVAGQCRQSFMLVMYAWIIQSLLVNWGIIELPYKASLPLFDNLVCIVLEGQIIIYGLVLNIRNTGFKQRFICPHHYLWWDGKTLSLIIDQCNKRPRLIVVFITSPCSVYALMKKLDLCYLFPGINTYWST